uniref:PDZ domain-containing protein n=1 Tax=Timema monikensis TaxID=170555 RepID=A0A7R9HN96_9NEOP|nr:unnamed protein product [Timema monikensis]
MDMLALLFLMLVCLLVGVGLTLAVQWVLFNRYLMRLPYVGPPDKPTRAQVRIPQMLIEALQSSDVPKKESCLALNLLFQFLFKELRNTRRVRRWFRHKLTLEFEELLTRTTTGKLFDKVTVSLASYHTTTGKLFDKVTVSLASYHTTTGKLFDKVTVSLASYHTTTGKLFDKVTVSLASYHTTTGKLFDKVTVSLASYHTTTGKLFDKVTVSLASYHTTTGKLFDKVTVGLASYHTTTGKLFDKVTVSLASYHTTTGKLFDKVTLLTRTTTGKLFDKVTVSLASYHTTTGKLLDKVTVSLASYHITTGKLFDKVTVSLASYHTTTGKLFDKVTVSLASYHTNTGKLLDKVTKGEMGHKRLGTTAIASYHTTTGKLFDKVTIREIDLGSQFPAIRSITVKDAVLYEEHQNLDTVDLCVDLEYSGGFQISIDANMLLGKVAYLAVKVNHLSGQARLQFTRHPYTHWSFSFYTEPCLELQVESQFQGRPLPQINSLIANQVTLACSHPREELHSFCWRVVKRRIRKSLKKKHILPQYKLRYKPFFSKCEVEEEWSGRSLTPGTLQVTVEEVTRLKSFLVQGDIYCSLAVDSTAWVEMFHSENSSYMTLDLSLHKLPSQPLGVVFKQEFVSDRYQACVLVESITPQSSASCSDLRCGDILVAVEGKKVTSIGQVGKLMKSAGERFQVRVERKSNYKVHTLETISDKDIISEKDPDTAQLKVTKGSKSGGQFSLPGSPVLGRTGLRHRRNSGEKTESDSSSSSPASMPASPAKKGTDGNNKSGQPSNTLDKEDRGEGDGGGSYLQINKTREMVHSQVILFNETLLFNIQEDHKYLNVSVWSKACVEPPNKQTAGPLPGRDILLGHISVPLAALEVECSNTKLGHHIDNFYLLPPDPHIAMSQTHKLSGHSGFEPCLCYGDILLSFQYHTLGGAPPPRPPTPTITPMNQTLSPGEADRSKVGQHNFIRTHFTRTTQCGFCGKKVSEAYVMSTATVVLLPLSFAYRIRKTAICLRGAICILFVIQKINVRSSLITRDPSWSGVPQSRLTLFNCPQIWLKDAVQCCDCSMTCHKKCVNKCQSTTTCGFQRRASALPGDVTGGDTLGVPQTQARRASAQPEIITTTADEGDTLAPAQRRGLGSLLASVASAAQGRGLKRAGSAHNLALPVSSSSNNLSRSLPPSPQHSPNVSRKASLLGNPFQFPHSLLDSDVTAALDHLLQHPNDDTLMSIAKSTGKDLYSSLSLQERRDKINQMIVKLKAAMDSETQSRMQLAKEQQERKDPETNTKIAFLVGKSDERVQALAVLMLHFCAGLQHAQDQEEANKSRDVSFPLEDLSIATSCSFHETTDIS